MKKKNLIRENKKLKILSTIDDLTQLYNRRFLNEKMVDEFNRAIRYTRPLSFLFIDVDYLKAVNDLKGHSIGDKCLKEIADLIAATLRSTDCCGRLGGDEFLVILPETPELGASFIAERIRTDVEALAIHCTVSIGIASLPNPSIQNEHSLLELADKALYQAKISHNTIKVIDL